MSERTGSGATRSLKAASLLALGLALGAPSAHAENRLGGHFGAVFPLVTRTAGETTTITDDFTIGFPMGITIKKTDKFAFDLELVAGVQNDPLNVSLTIHPGVLFGLEHGYTFGARVAFDVNAASWGFTPLLNKAFDKGDHALFVEAVLPIRFQEDSLGDSQTSIGFGIHVGVGF
jgi:hypothetical protein